MFGNLDLGQVKKGIMDRKTRRATLRQINHILILAKAAGKKFNFGAISKLTIPEIYNLVRELRAEANKRLIKKYQEFYGCKPHPSELWGVK